MAKRTVEVTVCDVCERDSPLFSECIVCERQMCVTCPTTVPGCIVSAPICRDCANGPKAKEIFAKYAPLIDAPRKKRDAELRRLGASVRRTLKAVA